MRKDLHILSYLQNIITINKSRDVGKGAGNMLQIPEEEGGGGHATNT